MDPLRAGLPAVGVSWRLARTPQCSIVQRTRARAARPRRSVSRFRVRVGAIRFIIRFKSRSIFLTMLLGEPRPHLTSVGLELGKTAFSYASARLRPGNHRRRSGEDPARLGSFDCSHRGALVGRFASGPTPVRPVRIPKLTCTAERGPSAPAQRRQRAIVVATGEELNTQGHASFGVSSGTQSECALPSLRAGRRVGLECLTAYETEAPRPGDRPPWPVPKSNPRARHDPARGLPSPTRSARTKRSLHFSACPAAIQASSRRLVRTRSSAYRACISRSRGTRWRVAPPSRPLLAPGRAEGGIVVRLARRSESPERLREPVGSS